LTRAALAAELRREQARAHADLLAAGGEDFMERLDVGTLGDNSLGSRSGGDHHSHAGNNGKLDELHG